MSTPQLHVDVDVRLDENTALPVDETFVEQVLGQAASVVGEYGEISVSFVTDEEIHTLNRDYREVDAPTDVLSFALLEGEDGFVESEPRILGDIVVSVPTALRQAQAYGHSVTRELGFLLVHGYLHLVGYDHQDEAAEREMFALQEEVLKRMGLPRGPVAPGNHV